MSGYAKALEGFLRLFPRKIHVTFIDAATGLEIGINKMFLDQLPDKFNKPTEINAMGKLWRVLEANPKKADDFMFTRKLSLTVIDALLPDKMNSRYYIPSIAHGLPETSENNLFNEFVIDLPVQSWRQIELLPATVLPQVEEDVSIINSILHPEKKSNLLLGYARLHLRDKIMLQNHSIPFDTFCELIGITEKGAVRITAADGRFVKDGFVVRSFNYEYYGIVQDGFIKTLCLKEFDCVDDELLIVLSTFELVLAIWCEAMIITAEVKEGVENASDALNASQESDAMIM